MNSEWHIVDANFGILPRDIEITNMLRNAIERYDLKVNFNINAAKNSVDRNVDIATAFGLSGRDSASVALQSTDDDVLEKTGRANLSRDKLVMQIARFKERGLRPMTDILILLPGDTLEKHVKTLRDCLDLGFERINFAEIRLLKGSNYENPEFRSRLEVTTKFRPIYGAYGRYFGENIYELEESVRSSSYMSEREMIEMKILHWLLYFTWNMGAYKTLLIHGLRLGLNPVDVLYKIVITQSPQLLKMFNRFRQEAADEWFDTRQQMIEHYDHADDFDNLVKSFVKLNFKYMAIFYKDKDAYIQLGLEIRRIVQLFIVENHIGQMELFDQLYEMTDILLSKDPLQSTFCKEFSLTGECASILVGDDKIKEKERLDVRVYRPESFVVFCKYHLQKNGKKDLSENNLAYFFGCGGWSKLSNIVECV